MNATNCPRTASERKTRITISLTEIELAMLCGISAGLRMSLQEAIKFKLFGRAGATKPQLIEMIRGFDEDGGYDHAEDFVKSFHAGVGQGEALVSFLKTAELRLAVAMHNVYDDYDGRKDDGDEVDGDDGAEPPDRGELTEQRRPPWSRANLVSSSAGRPGRPPPSRKRCHSRSTTFAGSSTPFR
jgi:hypothetical protein